MRLSVLVLSYIPPWPALFQSRSVIHAVAFLISAMVVARNSLAMSVAMTFFFASMSCLRLRSRSKTVFAVISNPASPASEVDGLAAAEPVVGGLVGWLLTADDLPFGETVVGWLSGRSSPVPDTTTLGRRSAVAGTDRRPPRPAPYFPLCR